MATIKKAQAGATTKKTLVKKSPAKKTSTKTKSSINTLYPGPGDINMILRKKERISTEMSKNGKSVKKAQMGGFVSNEFGAKSIAKSKPKPKLMDSKIKPKKDIYAFQGKKGMLAKSGTNLKKK
jgi:hypothetical protein